MKKSQQQQQQQAEPRSSSSCAACKFLKRRCTSNCQFAPYFRSDEPRKFAKVHKVFGASNVSKILNEVAEHEREDAVNSLVYEAEVRLRDPVYGCIGAIASLQSRMMELQNDLILARARLSFYYADHHQQQQLQPPKHEELLQVLVPFSGASAACAFHDEVVVVPEQAGNVYYSNENMVGNSSNQYSMPFDHQDQQQLSQLLHYYPHY